MKSFLLLCFASCSPAFGHNSESYKRQHAIDVFGFPLPVAGETLSFVYEANNFYLNGNKSIKFWLPSKPFLQNLKKDLLPFRPEVNITGIPQVRKVALDAVKDVYGRYRFESNPMVVKKYTLDPRLFKYHRVPHSKSKKTIVFYGYKVGLNIILTERVAFKVSNETYGPIIVPPYRLVDATEDDAIDLEISPFFRIYEDVNFS
jgi:hypothetical protein